ncbi:glycosyltransferase family 2 protein [Bacteroides oleiciplenus]|uniref:Glycosyltransferase family 2 protein n=1 Tax=Bacteroides oleiciplenus TaxID=626931 RepID=A0A3E5BCE1_9BACE|nr:glycosyltransferase family 2 protein [Bacteroides oleiciplenus]RGN35270.1 glycosyltransferase family 2 protein [Bacteroides oleiciplenus]
MAKFSIITPQFNSFNLMNRYFDSLLNQTYKDFEVIIVDDCSTDDSYEKLQKLVKISPLNIILKQTLKNSGPGNARNIGIENATGEWITFVDNDDWIEFNLLEKVNNIIEQEKINCIIYDYYIYRDDKIEVSKSMYIDKGGRKSVSDCIMSCRNHTVGKFYKLSECASVRFPDIRKCEDVAYVCQAIEACESVYYFNEPLYYYLQRSMSLSNNKKLDEADMIIAFSILEDKLGEKYPEELKEKSVCDILYGVLLMMCKAGKSNQEIITYINSYEYRYPQWYKCKIIEYLGKGKQIFLFCAKYRFVWGLKVLAYIHSKMV